MTEEVELMRLQDDGCPHTEEAMTDAELSEIKRNAVDCTAGDVYALVGEVERLREQVAKLQRFKDYVHARLDAAGVPVDPESPHKAEGCRVGGRLDVVFAERAALRADRDALDARMGDAFTRTPGSQQPETGDSLLDWLHGIYTVPVNDGAGPLNGSTTFTRRFPTLKLNLEAAVEIVRLRAAASAVLFWRNADGSFVDGFMAQEKLNELAALFPEGYQHWPGPRVAVTEDDGSPD